MAKLKLSNDLKSKMKGKVKSDKGYNPISKQMIMGTDTNVNASKFFGMMFRSQVQTHMFHLMTNSHADHLALNAFYTGMTELIDTLVEAYQGTHGLIKNYPTNISLTNVYDPVGFLVEFRNYIQENRESVCPHSNFQNAVDAVLDLIDSTNYKLTKLIK